jgi:hypothetical protein
MSIGRRGSSRSPTVGFPLTRRELWACALSFPVGLVVAVLRAAREFLVGGHGWEVLDVWLRHRAVGVGSAMRAGRAARCTNRTGDTAGGVAGGEQV